MKRLLIIRFSALGDVAMLVPVIQALAEQYPELAITVLSQQRFADVFAKLPAHVSFHGVNLKTQSLHEIAAGLGSYDLVADMHGVIRSVYIRATQRLRGACVAVVDKGRINKSLLIRGKIHHPLKHMTERYADVLAKLGYPIQLGANPTVATTKDCFTSDNGPITDQLRTDYGPTTNRRGIGIAPFAAHKGKIYPLEKMEQVVRMLSERGEHVVLFGGGEKEKQILAQWAERYPNVENLSGRYSLGEEINYMQKLRVMLTMDSANMHLASLAGTRVISIWGATDPKAGFLGYGQRIEDCVMHADLPCRPCSVYGNRACKYDDYHCMEINPEDIVKRLIK